MEENFVLDGNKAIAEFMSLQTEPTEKNFVAYYPHHKETSGKYLSAIELKYHTSWDWLMPVIEKISKMPTDNAAAYGTHYVRSMLPTAKKFWLFRFNQMFLHEENTLIEAAYKAVVEFIEFKNEKI